MIAHVQAQTGGQSPMLRVTGPKTLSNSFLGTTRQVCVVTRDLERTLAGFVAMGIGPWRIFTFGPHNCTEQTYRGKAQPHTMRLATGWTGDSFWEVIQPLEGQSIYQDWLDNHGEGVQHVVQTCGTMTFEEKVEEFRQRGLEVAQSGRWAKHVRYAYFDAEPLIGVAVEISAIDEGAVLPEPEAWYPGPPEE